MVFKILPLILILTGCSTKYIVEVQEVFIPILENREVPYELSNFQLPPVPIFSSPSSPGISSCLIPEEEEKLKLFIFQMNLQLRAWHEWSKE
jgi:PBP1b-binding outer membrane lipoprotein LpoB